jgi:quercetin dioxygenase-like cupin family protein
MATAAGVAYLGQRSGPREASILPLRTPPGDVDVLSGDPDVPDQSFVMRIRELPGTVIPPHSHPVDEHLTVVQGTFYLGFGSRYDSTKLTRLDAGDYAFAPAGTIMFGYVPDSAIVQVHGIGPFHIRWLYGAVTADDSLAPTTFRFGRGEDVVTSRGRGRIEQAYASGPLIMYEIQRSDGFRFMAHERDLRRP